MDFFIPSKSKDSSEEGNLKWWQLSLIGLVARLVPVFFLDRHWYKNNWAFHCPFLYFSCYWNLYCIQFISQNDS